MDGGQIINLKPALQEALAKWKESRKPLIETREAAVKKFVDDMPRTYFSADHREKWFKSAVTVDYLDGALARFYKQITMRIMTLVGGASEDLMAGMFVLRERILALEMELAELKANPPTLIASYRGIWQPGGSKRGDVVTLDGSLWLAMSDTDAKPGVGDTFKLIVKRGKDGKDIRP